MSGNVGIARQLRTCNRVHPELHHTDLENGEEDSRDGEVEETDSLKGVDCDDDEGLTDLELTETADDDEPQHRRQRHCAKPHERKAPQQHAMGNPQRQRTKRFQSAPSCPRTDIHTVAARAGLAQIKKGGSSLRTCACNDGVAQHEGKQQQRSENGRFAGMEDHARRASRRVSKARDTLYAYVMECEAAGRPAVASFSIAQLGSDGKPDTIVWYSNSSYHDMMINSEVTVDGHPTRPHMLLKHFSSQALARLPSPQQPKQQPCPDPSPEAQPAAQGPNPPCESGGWGLDLELVPEPELAGEHASLQQQQSQPPPLQQQPQPPLQQQQPQAPHQQKQSRHQQQPQLRQQQPKPPTASVPRTEERPAAVAAAGAVVNISSRPTFPGHTAPPTNVAEAVNGSHFSVQQVRNLVSTTRTLLDLPNDKKPDWFDGTTWGGKNLNTSQAPAHLIDLLGGLLRTGKLTADFPDRLSAKVREVAPAQWASQVKAEKLASFVTHLKHLTGRLPDQRCVRLDPPPGDAAGSHPAGPNNQPASPLQPGGVALVATTAHRQTVDDACSAAVLPVGASAPSKAARVEDYCRTGRPGEAFAPPAVHAGPSVPSAPPLPPTAAAEIGPLTALGTLQLPAVNLRASVPTVPALSAAATVPLATRLAGDPLACGDPSFSGMADSGTEPSGTRDAENSSEKPIVSPGPSTQHTSRARRRSAQAALSLLAAVAQSSCRRRSGGALPAHGVRIGANVSGDGGGTAPASMLDSGLQLGGADGTMGGVVSHGPSAAVRSKRRGSGDDNPPMSPRVSKKYKSVSWLALYPPTLPSTTSCPGTAGGVGFHPDGGSGGTAPASTLGSSPQSGSSDSSMPAEAGHGQPAYVRVAGLQPGSGGGSSALGSSPQSDGADSGTVSEAGRGQPAYVRVAGLQPGSGGGSSALGSSPQSDGADSGTVSEAGRGQPAYVRVTGLQPGSGGGGTAPDSTLGSSPQSGVEDSRGPADRLSNWLDRTVWGRLLAVSHGCGILLLSYMVGLKGEGWKREV
ncbi:hypothetical protein Agub_g5621 [Astrephomene gubernaculifera]|uniref:Uncharacterized protein n=1 Tax=Astrephomene gubernaculifera TaxID=47775 RepID=A0AAD3DP93_9CHLO|nr:hypothetical protein Agub_g5621 [Astrephomene gubernaculifera]